MWRAKHQLFIIDACFGGLITTMGGAADKNRPDYIEQFITNKARQVITAGGNQVVLNRVFMNHLLRALNKNALGDTDGD